MVAWSVVLAYPLARDYTLAISKVSVLSLLRSLTLCLRTVWIVSSAFHLKVLLDLLSVALVSVWPWNEQLSFQYRGVILVLRA